MKFCHLPVQAAVLMGLSGWAQAQSLVELYDAARGYDAAYQSAKLQMDATLSKTDQAIAGILPTVTSTAGVSRSNIVGMIDALSPNAATTYDRIYGAQTTSISASQALYRPANVAAYVQGKRQREQAYAVLASAEQDLMVRLSQAYFDVLASQDSLTFVKAQKIAVNEQLASAKRNFEVGTATITDTHEAQARFDLALAQEIAAQNDLEVKRNALAVITGQVPPELRSLRSGVKLSSPQPSSLDQWVHSAETGNFSVIVQGLLVDIAKLEISRNRAGHLPTLDGVATQSQRKDLTFTSPTTNTTSAVGLQLTIPLFAGFSTTSKIREAISLENQARANLDTAKRAAMQNARAAYLGVQSGLSQIRALEAAEVSSNSALESNKLGYDVGVRINIDRAIPALVPRMQDHLPDACLLERLAFRRAPEACRCPAEVRSGRQAGSPRRNARPIRPGRPSPP